MSLTLMCKPMGSFFADTMKSFKFCAIIDIFGSCRCLLLKGMNISTHRERFSSGCDLHSMCWCAVCCNRERYFFVYGRTQLKVTEKAAACSSWMTSMYVVWKILCHFEGRSTSVCFGFNQYMGIFLPNNCVDPLHSSHPFSVVTSATRCLGSSNYLLFPFILQTAVLLEDAIFMQFFFKDLLWPQSLL